MSGLGAGARSTEGIGKDAELFVRRKHTAQPRAATKSEMNGGRAVDRRSSEDAPIHSAHVHVQRTHFNIPRPRLISGSGPVPAHRTKEIVP